MTADHSVYVCVLYVCDKMERAEREMEKSIESRLTQWTSLTWVLARLRSATRSLRTSRSASCNGVALGTVWVERSPSECCRPFAALCRLCSHCTGCTPGLLSLEEQEGADRRTFSVIYCKRVNKTDGCISSNRLERIDGFN